MDYAPAIRPCTLQDAPALGLVGAATFLETFAGKLDGEAIVAHCAQAHDPDRYRQLIGMGCHAWLAEIEPGRAPVGYALIGPSLLTMARPGELDLKRIYVLDRWHGAGVGAALMAAATAYARADGQSRLLVGVYSGNAKAQAFYAKWGFQRVGERQFNVGSKVYQDWVYAFDL